MASSNTSFVSSPLNDLAGVQASVYSVKAKNWIAPSEPVGDIEQAKTRAMERAEGYLRHAASLELPVLIWKDARSV